MMQEKIVSDDMGEFVEFSDERFPDRKFGRRLGKAGDVVSTASGKVADDIGFARERAARYFDRLSSEQGTK